MIKIVLESKDFKSYKRLTLVENNSDRTEKLSGRNQSHSRFLLALRSFMPPQWTTKANILKYWSGFKYNPLYKPLQARKIFDPKGFFLFH